MSHSLLEHSEQALEAELARRRKSRLAGRCDYCGGESTDPPCKFPERHACTVADDNKTPQKDCWSCGRSKRVKAMCSTCNGTGKVVDELAAIFTVNLTAIFGERSSEFSMVTRTKLRELWEIGRQGAKLPNVFGNPSPLSAARTGIDGRMTFFIHDEVALTDASRPSLSEETQQAIDQFENKSLFSTDLDIVITQPPSFSLRGLLGALPPELDKDNIS